MGVNYLTKRGVQQFTVTIASGNTTGTTTINSVGSLAFIVWGGSTTSVATATNEGYAYVQLTNSTTITATRNTGTAGTITITGSVVDATSNLVNSIHQGTLVIANGQSSSPLSGNISVVFANTAPQYLGCTTTTGTISCGNTMAYVELLNDAGLYFPIANRGGSTNALTVGYVMVEFQPGVLTSNAVQKLLPASSGTVTSWTATPSTVNMNNTITFYGGNDIVSASTATPTAFCNGQLTANNTFTVNVNTGNTTVKTYSASLVEFRPGVLASNVQRGTTTISASTSATQSITSANSATSVAPFLGNTATTTNSLTASMASTTFTNNTTLTFNLGTSSTVVNSWEVWNFPAYANGNMMMCF